MTNKELKNRFTYHPPPGPREIAAYEATRTRAHEFATYLVATCRMSRELSRALSALEDVVFNSNASIARRGLLGEPTERAHPRPEDALVGSVQQSED